MFIAFICLIVFGDFVYVLFDVLILCIYMFDDV